MRCLLYLLLCLAAISCLKRPAGIEPPSPEGTPPGLDGSAGTGNPPLIIEDPCMLNPDDCLPSILPPEPPPTGNTGDNIDNTDTTDNTNTGGGSLIVDAPAFNDLTLLSSVVLTARCDNCLYPVGNDATELQCEISKGCSDGFTFVTSTTLLRRHEHQQVLCASDTKIGRDLASLHLKCTFKHKKSWSFDHKSSDEITLSREIVANQHLCVITTNLMLSSASPIPEVHIMHINCNDIDLSNKKHRLALTFSW